MQIYKTVVIFLFLFFSILIGELFAQSAEITFNVNLQPQLKDSIFIPGRDRILITGTQEPFSRINNRLSDNSTPKDSVYSVTLRFSQTDINRRFSYNYVMYIDGTPQRENMRRQIKVTRGKHNLDALYFNTFAW